MLRNAFMLALRAIRRNMLRSALTVLGIVIGVAAVIIMVTLGAGATRQVTQSIASLGSNVLMIMPGHRGGPGTTSALPFRTADAQAVAREVRSVSDVAPIVNSSTIAVVGNESWSTSVTGTEVAFFTIRNWTIEAGRFFTESEARAGRAVCVIGATVRSRLFGTRDPVGQSIRLTKMSCDVVGLLAPKGQSTMGSDQDDTIIMPLRTVQRRITGKLDVNMIQVAARPDVSLQRAQREIRALMRARRHLRSGEEDDFQIRDPTQITTMVTGTTQLLTTLLSAVAAVSLLVGGIGIMNIMLVSVTERTREIGVRLAIGAMAHDVLTQFLVEAVVLSSFGGFLGIVLAMIASYVLAGMMGVPFVVDMKIVVIAFVFSALVGVIFGYFPARRASRLKPIDALRHE